MGITPFSEYRAELESGNIFDYFVAPSFFKQFLDSRPMLIYGSRGSGKTTLFRALCISETQDKTEYLSKNSYFGVYYRVDLNVTASFRGEDIPEAKRKGIFAHYFSSAINYELLRQINLLLEDGTITISKKNESTFSSRYGRLISNHKEIQTISELAALFEEELYNIREYINNGPIDAYPHIGDYQSIMNKLCEDLFRIIPEFNFLDKTAFFLIDEFEGLSVEQQSIVLSFVKYANTWHTFKICMRPDGLKTAETIGKEYIRETDDIKTVDLDDLILKNHDSLLEYASAVCERRMALYYSKNNYTRGSMLFSEMFETISEEKKAQLLIKGKEQVIANMIADFLPDTMTDASAYFSNHFQDFLLFRLLFYKKGYSKDTIEDLWVKYKDNNYTIPKTIDKSFKSNYSKALLYYTHFIFSKPIWYSGFETLVDISGGTMRYLLEICDVIFERAETEKKFDYQNPSPIPYTIQTSAINDISGKRLSQISAIPEIGPNIRRFVIALGEICRLYHKEETISKIEPNHFSLKNTSGESNDNISDFLRECVTRGVLRKKKNNKKKNVGIGYDEYLYLLHPIYIPAFGISARKKQKLEFSIEEIKKLSSNNTKIISEVLREYSKKTKQPVSSETQLTLTEINEE